MIPTITLNPHSRAQLNGLDQMVQVQDESGQQVGVFLPLPTYKALLKSLRVPEFSEEEMERRRKEPGRCSLEEFWRKLACNEVHGNLDTHCSE